MREDIGGEGLSNLLIKPEKKTQKMQQILLLMF